MEDWALIANVLMTGATCFMAYATWLMARATKKSLEAQWKPYVAVYPRLRKDDSQALQLVIENIGSAPAYNVKFEIPSNLMYNAWGISSGGKTKAKIFSEGPFITGIPYLPPRGKRIINWGQFGGILNSLQGKQAEVIIFFSDALGNQEPPVKSILDIVDFEMTAGESSLEYRIATAIEKNFKQVECLNSILEKKLNSYSSKDAYMWAYIAVQLGLPIELAERQKFDDGLSDEQRTSAEMLARSLLKSFRPEMVKDEDES
ncbi:hypothetical protein [Desulfovibrio sp. QI0442]